MKKMDKNRKMIVGSWVKLVAVWAAWVVVLAWLLWSLGVELAQQRRIETSQVKALQLDVDKINVLRERLEGR